MEEIGNEGDAVLIPTGIINHEVVTNLSVHHIHENILQHRAVVIPHLLSDKECTAMVDFVESRNSTCEVKGLSLIPANSRKEYRNCLRVCGTSEDISNIIFNRVQKTVEQLSEDNKVCDTSTSDQFLCNGVGMHGVWHMKSVNPFFRLVKYESGGHFGPHYDSDYVIDPLRLRSLKTLMIYLNDDYTHGETNFCHDHALNYDDNKKLYCAREDTIFASYKPKRGDCILFDHKLLHEGQTVTEGGKYIMRSELMYERVLDDSVVVSDEQRVIDEALVVWFEGSKLEADGDVPGAIKKYKHALRLFPDIESHLK